MWHRFHDGVTEIGYSDRLGRTVSTFASITKLPATRCTWKPSGIANRSVTCREYLEFMSDDAYARPEFWLSEGWEAVRKQGWRAPLYWERDATDSTGWRIFTLRGWHPLSALLDTPVCHVSFFEADAFARWRGCRLPREAEWELAANGSSIHGNLLETGRLHPAIASGDGLDQLFGDCWEWTASPYTGYPGYKPLPGALGEYNGKFMSGQMILRGGSCVTPASHLRATYRNFFQPATRWQFTRNTFGRLKGLKHEYNDGVSDIRSEKPRPLDAREALIDEVWRGLRRRPRSLVPWMLYDAEGSRLFERITALPEYYPTRTERGILASYAEAIIAATGSDYSRPLRLLELGAGTAAKTGILLEAATRLRNEVIYLPVDVSSDALDAACDSIGCLLPDVQLQPMVANYVTHPPKLERFERDHARDVHRFEHRQLLAEGGSRHSSQSEV